MQEGIPGTEKSVLNNRTPLMELTFYWVEKNDKQISSLPGGNKSLENNKVA